MIDKNENSEPLNSIEDWEDFVADRYPEDGTTKAKEEYRNYDDPGRDTVREFYRLNHKHQSFEFVQKKRAEFLTLDRREMTVWEAAEFLNTLVDDSDPDTDLSQLEHLLQTSEAIRADGHEDWFVLTGFLHDLGKILCLFGEPQWAVVGDTFPVGCSYSDSIVYPEFFEANPDSQNGDYQTECGVYEAGCGLENVTMSWGHDEYMYHVVRDHMPEPALYMIRYHSFYPWHKEDAYGHLLNDKDRELLPWVQKFNPYDLYSKTPEKPVFAELKPYYDSLMKKYLPEKLTF